MYVSHTSKVYRCRDCKQQISVADIDEIFQEYLKEYLKSIDLSTYLTETDNEVKEKQALLESVKKERAKLQRNIDEWINLRVSKELSKEQFAVKYNPAEERLNQLSDQLPILEAEIDVRTIQLLSSDTVMREVKTLYDQWELLPYEQKRAIVETITTSINIVKDDITITLAYVPPIPENAKKSSHRLRGSCWRLT